MSVIRNLTAIAIVLSPATYSKAAAPPPPMSVGSSTDEQNTAAIEAAMQAWKHAAMAKDRAGLERVFHADLRYGHSTSEVQGKKETIDRDVNSPNIYKDIVFNSIDIKYYGNLAVLTDHEFFHIDDKGVDRTAGFGSLAVWIKTPQGWQMLARQVVKLPDGVTK